MNTFGIRSLATYFNDGDVLLLQVDGRTECRTVPTRNHQVIFHLDEHDSLESIEFLGVNRGSHRGPVELPPAEGNVAVGTIAIPTREPVEFAPTVFYSPEQARLLAQLSKEPPSQYIAIGDSLIAGLRNAWLAELLVLNIVDGANIQQLNALLGYSKG